MAANPFNKPGLKKAMGSKPKTSAGESLTSRVAKTMKKVDTKQARKAILKGK